MGLLALVKRIDSKETIKFANEAGIKSYVSSQAERSPMTPAFRHLFQLYWSVLLKEWDSCITYGDLGPGSLLDKQFPFERHMALPALIGAPAPIQLFLIKCLRKRFKKGSSLLKYFPESYGDSAAIPRFHNLIEWLMSPDCLTHPHVYAYRSSDQPSRLSVVEKSCLISRPITVTYGFKAILQACLRATGRTLLRDIWNIESAMNVDDQSLSHAFMFRHYADCFTADFKNGSGNFLHADIEGSLPSGIAFLEAESSTRLCEIVNQDPNMESEYVEAITLQMGDSACNFFLTASTFFLQVASIVEDRYKATRCDMGGIDRIVAHINGDGSEEWMRKLILEASKLCHCVGDDFIGLRKYYPAFIKITSANNIVLNEQKSSAPDSIPKETCGAWILNHGDSYEEIFPFRAPKIIPGYTNQTLLNCTQYLHKISGNEMVCRTMAITLAKYLGKRGNELLSLSRSLDEIGNPFGSGTPLQAYPVNLAVPAPLEDIYRAFFYLSQDLFPIYGTEGSRSRPMRYKLSRSTKHHATYSNLEDRGRIVADHHFCVSRNARILQITTICSELRLERLIAINKSDIELAFAGCSIG